MVMRERKQTCFVVMPFGEKKDADGEDIDFDDIYRFFFRRATGNLERGTLLIADLKRAGHSDFAVFSGDDLTAAMLMLMGGKGNISVTANVAPRLMHELCVAAMSDDVKKTREIQYKLLAVHKAMFTEANPIPVKWALHEMGKITAGIRLPLTNTSQSSNL